MPAKVATRYQSKRKFEQMKELDDQSAPQTQQHRNPTARQRFSARLQSTKASSATTSDCTKSVPVTAIGTKKKKPTVPLAKPKHEMTEAEKKEDRARRNRASALKSRNKRRQRLAFLEVECQRLCERIRLLENENAGLRRENSTLREQRDLNKVVAAPKPVVAAPKPIVLKPKVEPQVMAPPKIITLAPKSTSAFQRKSSLQVDDKLQLDPETILPYDDFVDSLETVKDWAAIDDAILDINWGGDDACPIPQSPRLGCGASLSQSQHFFERMISI